MCAWVDGYYLFKKELNMNNIMFGYKRNSHGETVIDNFAKIIINKIYSMYLNGLSLGKIVKQL